MGDRCMLEYFGHMKVLKNNDIQYSIQVLLQVYILVDMYGVCSSNELHHRSMMM
jgi:hypothetical protein